jgi:hypothetical protein
MSSLLKLIGWMTDWLEAAAGKRRTTTTQRGSRSSMDNVTLGGICIAVSLGAFFLINILSIQSWLQRDDEPVEEAKPR